MIQFMLEQKQQDKLDVWFAEQYAKTDTMSDGAVGGAFTYHFTPTSIGVVTKVSNAHTGETIDISDYENW